jgi:outer membrane protein TolC
MILGITHSVADSSPPKIPDHPISLEEAMKLALTNSQKMNQIIARIEKAEAGIRKAKAAFFPKVSLYTEYTRSNDPIAYLLKTARQRLLPPNANFNQPGTFDNYEIGINFQYNLFQGGKKFYNKDLAHSVLAEEHIERETIENALLASVINAYYDALVALDLIKIAEESVATVETQLRLMTVRYNTGGVLKSDVLSLEVRLAEVKETRVRSKNLHQRALANLSTLLGFGPHVQLSLLENENLHTEYPDTYDKGIKIALTNRSEIKKIYEKIKQSKIGLKISQAGYLPSLDFIATRFYDAEDMAFYEDRNNWGLYVKLSWDIFEGGKTRAEVAQAKKSFKELMANYNYMILQVKLDVKNAYLNIEDAKARLTVTESSVVSAEESYKLVKSQYEGGSVTISRYMEAELDRNQAKTRSIIAFYDKAKGQAEIARALGLWGNWNDKENK